MENPVRCWLCGSESSFLFRGLATLGIDYPGAVRWICAECIEKVKLA